MSKWKFLIKIFYNNRTVSPYFTVFNEEIPFSDKNSLKKDDIVISKPDADKSSILGSIKKAFSSNPWKTRRTNSNLSTMNTLI